MYSEYHLLLLPRTMYHIIPRDRDRTRDRDRDGEGEGESIGK